MSEDTRRFERAIALFDAANAEDPRDHLAGGRDGCAAPSTGGALRAPGPPLAPGQPHPAAPADDLAGGRDEAAPPRPPLAPGQPHPAAPADDLAGGRGEAAPPRPPLAPGQPHPAAPALATAPERPDLADLAALEWARSEVFFEGLADPADPRERGLEPEVFAAARLRLAPALRLVRTAHDVVPLWRALEVGEAVPSPAPRPAAVAVWRAGFDVFHAALEEDEAAALERALAGEPLAHVCAAFGERPDAAQAAFDALSSWVHDGWIAGVEPAR